MVWGQLKDVPGRTNLSVPARPHPLRLGLAMEELAVAMIVSEQKRPWAKLVNMLSAARRCPYCADPDFSWASGEGQQP